MLSNLTGDAVGTVHLIFAMVAVVSGTLVLSMKKGTTRHKRVGRIYGFSMIVMLVTAFMIYRLFGRFGTFHYTAIISVLTLAAGMVPPLFLRSNPNWLRWHFGFMYWSVIGLYAAFAAEVMVRIPETPFYGMVGVATFMVIALGVLGFVVFQKRWILVG